MAGSIEEGGRHEVLAIASEDGGDESGSSAADMSGTAPDTVMLVVLVSAAGLILTLGLARSRIAPRLASQDEAAFPAECATMAGVDTVACCSEQMSARHDQVPSPGIQSSEDGDERVEELAGEGGLGRRGMSGKPAWQRECYVVFDSSEIQVI